jgi:hypothetical protein
MARTAKLIRWINKSDITIYYLGKKVFRGTPAECDQFEVSFNKYGTNVEAAEQLLQELLAEDEVKADADITENEAKVLRAIATNCFNVLNYGIPTSFEEADNDVWSDLIDDAKIPSGLAPRSIAGVCGSLARKGMVVSSDWDDNERCIRLTEAGFDAMMKFYNNDLEA